MTRTLRFNSGLPLAFGDVLWYEKGQFIRQQTFNSSGIGERKKITAKETMSLIKHRFDR